MAVPYTFGSATTSIPLSQLDSNFATAITLGNTAVQRKGSYYLIGYKVNANRGHIVGRVYNRIRIALYFNVYGSNGIAKRSNQIAAVLYLYPNRIRIRITLIALCLG